jgi:hypothetical protein
MLERSGGFCTPARLTALKPDPSRCRIIACERAAHGPYAMSDTRRDLSTARLSATAALFLAALPTVLFGQTSEQYALMGQKLWAGFECGALAEHAGKAEESGRLYRLGYDQGKTLLDAFRAGKVDEQVKGKLPIAVLFLLDGGPTVDFILGRIFESAMQHTTQQLFEATNNKETQKIIARQNFASRIAGCCDAGSFFEKALATN